MTVDQEAVRTRRIKKTSFKDSMTSQTQLQWDLHRSLKSLWRFQKLLKNQILRTLTFQDNQPNFEDQLKKNNKTS